MPHSDNSPGDFEQDKDKSCTQVVGSTWSKSQEYR